MLTTFLLGFKINAGRTRVDVEKSMTLDTIAEER
jgi:hypothetical protein